MAKVLLQIHINNLRIADVDTGSAVAIGNNYFFDWKTYSKSNSGFGRLSGDGSSMSNTAFRVDDPDFQDMISNEFPAESGLQRLLEGDE